MTTFTKIHRARLFQDRFRAWCERTGRELPASAATCERWADEFVAMDGDTAGHRTYVERLMA